MARKKGNRKKQKTDRQSGNNKRQKLIDELADAISNHGSSTRLADKLLANLKRPSCKLNVRQIKDEIGRTTLEGKVKSKLCNLAA